MRCASGAEWRAYSGIATHTDATGTVEHRNDYSRRFEKALLATAPKGTVPPGIPEIDGRTRPKNTGS